MPHKRSVKTGVYITAAMSFLCFTGAYAETTAPLTVGAVIVTAQPQGRFIDMTGTVQARETVPVAFAQAGRITTLNFEVGDAVSAGDIVAELDPAQAAAAERAASANLDAAAASLAQAEQAYIRARDLLARGAGTQADLDAAEQTYFGAEAGRDEAAAGLAKARQAVEDMVVLAPVTGIIVARTAEQGQIAAAGQTVVTIARGGTREAVFSLPNESALDDMLGTEITVHLLDDPMIVATGQVSEVAPMVQTGTVGLKVALPESAEGFGLGAPVQARFPLSQDTTITVPAPALTTDRGLNAVWVIDSETHAVSLRQVTIAGFTSESVTIDDGVAEGETVATSGAHQLFPGRVVHALVEGNAR